MDPGRPRATAIAITGGRILDLPDYPDQVSAERVVDLRGAALLPGFHDAHNHMTWFGLSLIEVDLRSPGLRSLDELYAAVPRRAQATDPGEAIPAREAVRAYTYGSAYASHQEEVKGTIAPGKLAGLVVLSEDPTAVAPDRIAGLEVLATIVDGRCGYDRGAIDGLS